MPGIRIFIDSIAQSPKHITSVYWSLKSIITGAERNQFVLYPT